MKNQKSRTQREIVGSRINEPSMNCEESIGKILDSIRKEATLKVELAKLSCIVFVPPKVGIPRVRNFLR